MRPWLHALAVLAVVVVFAASFRSLRGAVGDSPWLALLLMFYFLGVAKIAEPLIVLRVPKALHGLRPWELEGDAIRRLRVPSFGRLLRRTPLRYFNPRVYLGRGRQDPRRVRAQAESAEASHFWAAVLFTPCIALAAATGRWSVAAWFTLAQLLVNVYPILHLRHVRGRLDRLIRRAPVAQPARA